MATMVNQVMNMKDSRWLTLEVCREFQRNKCTRPETECKFAHPPQHVEVQNGRVTACFDSIKGKCQRKDPPCKYLHPPQHLREQLLQNGRNNLILKNLQWQAAHASAGGLMPGMVSPAGVVPTTISHPYLGTIPSSPIPYPWPGTAAGAIQMAALPGTTEPNALINHQYPGMIPMSYPAANPIQQKIAGRADRLEVCREFQRSTCTRQANECRYAHPPENVTVDTTDNHVTVCMDFIKGKCSRDSCRYYHPPPHLQAQIKAAQQRANTAAGPGPTPTQPAALPQMVEVLTSKKRPRDPTDDLVLGTIPGMSYKRMAVADSKSGIPMYQPGYQQVYQQAVMAMQMQQQQPYIPVSLPMFFEPAVQQPLVMAFGSQFTNPNDNDSSDDQSKTLATLPLCRDFKLGNCKRPQCKYIHLMEDYVEVTDGNVTLCRDALKGKCERARCKYYHIPASVPLIM